jgi:hypothetical protein
MKRASAALLLLAACGAPVKGIRCDKSDDQLCPTGYWCDGSFCVAESVEPPPVAAISGIAAAQAGPFAAALSGLGGKAKGEAYVEVKNAGKGEIELQSASVDEGTATCRPDVHVTGSSTTVQPGAATTYKLAVDTTYSKCSAASARIVFSIRGNGREFTAPLDLSFTP